MQQTQTTRYLTSRYLGFGNGSNGLYHSMSVFELSAIGPANWSKALQVGIELEAESELPNGNIISKMWNESLDSVSVVIESSQELNTRGKWELYILFLEVSLDILPIILTHCFRFT
ncbi:hypothetical protein PGTUg99_002316 [Puccinia graminis f. sp. tritici]|uniref:Uncharacterized protein n=1 Tax=Puccinia graminis f. sp. tritici TaxID=56615 RepID=A0A5B0LGU2_PUCGR|nr:hypothetical protein PGTUg99_006561 [Puccinia graminis f. sp. tritici]KAA1127610.1 hypothetical protein PGTUg99_002316 [Puccinia graminis f. sp. tritici]